MKTTSRTGKIVLTLLSVGLIASTVLVFAGFRTFEKGVPQRWTEELSLTDEQVNTINDAILERQKKKIELQSKIRIAQLELKEAMDSDDVNTDQIMQKAEEIGTYRTEMQKLTYSNLITVKKTLTPEQQKKLEEKRTEFRAKQRENAKQRGIRNRMPEYSNRRSGRRDMGSRAMPGQWQGYRGAGLREPGPLKDIPEKRMEGFNSEWRTHRKMQKRICAPDEADL